MKINCPDLSDPEIQKEHAAWLLQWHRSFAWLPVRMDNRHKIWLQHYEWRKQVEVSENYTTTRTWRRLPGAEKGWCFSRREFTGGW